MLHLLCTLLRSEESQSALRKDSQVMRRTAQLQKHRSPLFVSSTKLTQDNVPMFQDYFPPVAKAPLNDLIFPLKYMCLCVHVHVHLCWTGKGADKNHISSPKETVKMQSGAKTLGLGLCTFLCCFHVFLCLVNSSHLEKGRYHSFNLSNKHVLNSNYGPSLRIRH